MKKRVLAIGAHPDDIEIGCGGAIHLLSKHGYEVKFVVMTSGEEGTLSNKEAFRTARESEATKSAHVLGATEVMFFQQPDGLTTYSKETKIKLIKVIRDFKPSIAFVHSSFDCFPDHRVVSEISRSAIQGASGPWYSEGGASSHAIDEVYGFEVWNPIQQPQMTIDISEVMNTKLDALKCHLTQTESVNYLGAVKGLGEYRGAMSMVGKYAESFEVLKTRAFDRHFSKNF